MKTGVQFKLKGVRPQAIEAAREAARRSGLSLGEWLDTAIIETAAEAGIRPRPGFHEHPDDPSWTSGGYAAVHGRLSDIAERLDRLATRRGDAAPSPAADIEPTVRELESRLAAMADDAPPGREATPQRLADAIARLNARLDRLINPPESGGEPDSRAAAVEDEDELVALDPEPVQPAADPSFRLDQAIAEISARQRALDADSPGAMEAQPPSAEPPLEAPIASAPSAVPDISGLEQQLRYITEQLETLRRPSGVEHAIAALHRDFSEIGNSLAEALPRRTIEAIQTEMRSLADRIGLDRTHSADAFVLSGVEQSLSEVRDALNTLAPAESLAGFDEQVKAMSRKIDLLAATAPDPQALMQLAKSTAELRDLSSRVASGEALAALADEVRTVGAKLDRLASTEAADTEGINNLAQRIQALAAALDARADGAADTAQVEQLIKTLTDKLEAAPAAAERHGFEQLEAQIVQLAHRLEAADARLGKLGAIEHSLADVTAHLSEARGGASGPADAAQVEQLIHALTDKLETAPAAAERHGFEQLEAQIVQLAQKLDAADARLGNFGTIEHSIADFMAQLNETRVNAIAAAEQAARAAAQEIVRDSAGGGFEIDALKHELAEFRETQADIDRRTQDTLEAVHATLERLVDRLAQIDNDIHANADLAARAEPVPRNEVASSAQAALLAPPLVPSEGSVRPAPIPPTLRPAASPSRDHRSLSPNLPADHPLEPGSITPRGRPVTPAERIAASEAALASVGPAAATEPAGKANFIAAARRAAQAATSDSPEAVRAGGQNADESLFSAIGHTIAKRRLPLIVGFFALVLLIVSMQLVGGVFGSDPPGREPPRAAPADTTGALRAGTKAPDPPILPVATNAAVEPPPPGPAPQPEAAPVAATIAAAAPRSVAPLDGKTAPALPSPPASAPPGGVSTSMVGHPGPAILGAPLALAPTAHTAAAETLPPAIGGPGLRAAASAGNPGAEYEIATRYAEGRGVPLSFEEAVRWFERAAHHGLAPAQYRLGSLYEKGQGVKKDLQTARGLYTSAADKGNGKAMHNLAVLYAEGIDGKPDYRTASQWFRKAADRGVADSQYNLGILYARGIGVEQNLAESYKWFALAAQQGDQDAAKKRDEVSGRLDAQSLVAARLAVQTWTADPQTDDAVNVKVPPGGWDRPAPGIQATKLKPVPGSPRKSGSS